MENGENPRGVLTMSLLAVMVGITGGVSAWAFRMLIGVIHNFLFLGRFSFSYDANFHTPSGYWGVGIIIVPVIGALGVAWLVKNFAPEAKGHGVPEVIDAIHYGGGRIRPIVAVVKSLASGLCIGSGGSVGREGPIIQISTALASTLGQFFELPVRQRITLIAAGAASGIGATFNAPLGGIVFSMELMLVSVNAANIFQVALATVVATYIGRLLLGLAPAFNIPALRLPELHLMEPSALLFFLPLGIIIGLGSVLFIRGLYKAEDLFDAIPGNYYLRHALGMVCVGIMMYVTQRVTGNYYIEGLGYATIGDTLSGLLADPYFLLALLALKYIATCLTLGSGGSGGIFSPSLFMGGVAGAFFGQALHSLLPYIGIGASTFAVAGMAAAMGGTTGAVITAVIMIFEMTRDYNAIFPVLLCATTAYAVRKGLCRESIYTLKLLRKGHIVPEGLQAALESSMRVGDLMKKNFSVIESSGKAQNNHEVTIMTRDGKIVGPVHPVPASLHRRTSMESLITDRYIIVSPDIDMVNILRTLKKSGAELVLVSKNPGSLLADDIVGVLTKKEIIDEAERTAELL